MYIYNVTTNVQEDVHDQWVDWMKKEHIPQMIDTGKFTKALMTKVLVKEEMGGITYSVQYWAGSRQQLDAYYEEHARVLRRKLKLFEGKVVSFRTELQVVSEQ